MTVLCWRICVGVCVPIYMCVGVCFALCVPTDMCVCELLYFAGGMLSDVTGSIPGWDEVMGFIAMMKTVQNEKYSCVVFDTAPTGHTLRLLGLPGVRSHDAQWFNSVRSYYCLACRVRSRHHVVGRVCDPCHL